MILLFYSLLVVAPFGGVVFLLLLPYFVVVLIFCCCSHILLLLPYFVVAPIWCGSYIGSLFCGLFLCVLSSFVIILLRKRELVALLKLCCGYLCFCLFLTVPLVVLRSVVVVFPGHSYLLLYSKYHIIKPCGLL